MFGGLGFERDLDWPQDTYEAPYRQQLLEPVQKGLIWRADVWKTAFMA